MKLKKVQAGKSDIRNLILEIVEQKERIKELNDTQNEDRTKINEENCHEYNEKVMLQEVVIDYKEVMLEEESRLMQKSND
jgi:hypothetical protein